MKLFKKKGENSWGFFGVPVCTVQYFGVKVRKSKGGLVAGEEFSILRKVLYVIILTIMIDSLINDSQTE